MNTSIFLSLFGATAALPDYVEELFARSERVMSRFDPDSELARLNADPHPECAVSAELFAALETAVWAAHATGGLYDPTILAVLREAGYDRSFDRIADAIPFQNLSATATTGSTPLAPHRPGYSLVRLDRTRRRVSRPPGLLLDLGGMGKGWTVDRAADLLHREGPFLLNAGGDIYAHGNPCAERAWLVEIENPFLPDATLARVRIANRALATSSIAHRRWRQGASAQHHIIDPRTGRPAATDVVSVTVVAARTVLAEVYAKVALILGTDTGLRYLAGLPGVDGLICAADGHISHTDGFATMLEGEIASCKSASQPAHRARSRSTARPSSRPCRSQR